MAACVSSGAHQRRRRTLKENTMVKLHHLCFVLLALAGASVPIGAYTGYYVPSCGWSSVWTFSGSQVQYVCL
jgi:hypothetical protein